MIPSYTSIQAQMDPVQVYPVIATVDGKPARGGTAIPSGAILEGAPVKNAPYSAEAVNEIVMVLADGNRIINKEVTNIFRDSEGRTRREILPGNPKYIAPIDTTLPFRAEIRFESGIQISDPESRCVYKLDPQTHTAKKYKMLSFVLPIAIFGDKVTNSEKKSPSVPGEYAVIKVMEVPGNPQSARIESLGTRIIEGVDCEGKLVTTTIPAGQIGNEKPIVLTEESWYSPTLKTDVLRKRYDPRSGESRYRLINLIQAEQPASLFQVPADYKLIDASEEDKNTDRK
jgi:hypothetical protein